MNFEVDNEKKYITFKQDTCLGGVFIETKQPYDEDFVKHFKSLSVEEAIYLLYTHTRLKFDRTIR